MRLAGNAGRKNVAKNCHLGKFVGLYLRNSGTYRQSEKNLLRSNISSTCPHNVVNFGPLAAEIGLTGSAVIGALFGPSANLFKI